MKKCDLKLVLLLLVLMSAASSLSLLRTVIGIVNHGW
jgi:hypothetical protein